MCRYYYRDGLCANSSIEGTDCIGLDHCPLRFPAASGAVKIESEQSCGYDKWYGLYCDKYKRFFCAGKGNCDSFDEYMHHFARHLASTKGSESPHEVQI